MSPISFPFPLLLHLLHLLRRLLLPLLLHFFFNPFFFSPSLHVSSFALFIRRGPGEKKNEKSRCTLPAGAVGVWKRPPGDFWCCCLYFRLQRRRRRRNRRRTKLPGLSDPHRHTRPVLTTCNPFSRYPIAWGWRLHLLLPSAVLAISHQSMVADERFLIIRIPINHILSTIHGQTQRVTDVSQCTVSIGRVP